MMAQSSNHHQAFFLRAGHAWSIPSIPCQIQNRSRCHQCSMGPRPTLRFGSKCSATGSNEYPVTRIDCLGQSLSSQFSQLLNEKGLASPTQRRQPSHLMAPTAVVSSQMEALQRNNWPDVDSGLKTAFAFCKPYKCERMLPGQVGHTKSRTWLAKEEYVSFEEFHGIASSGAYSKLIDCDEWKPVSQMVFPSHRFPVAVQAVEVTPKEGSSISRYTFCLEKIGSGPYEGCWLTVGVRVGDYANI